ncbi:SRA stem-loop-interacting RNA-binding protein, mitochondrial [Dicentrarchus labrax]|uniref:SRA stem-loop interacting RNA binding protein n=1 Tax=Dicentrarchus labrax TaxID=13489 RepID=A0A8C4DS00_DICLA|nr:SRA stem-loop-interacting RNA-binding protein, mitochondrial [Dicentrarchus labrax]
MAASMKKSFEVFVSKVPWTVASKQMREYFGQFGTVKFCRLPFDKDTGFHKGFGWVAFQSEEEMNNVLQKDTHMLEGAKLTVVTNKRPLWQKNDKNDDYN